MDTLHSKKSVLEAIERAKKENDAEEVVFWQQYLELIARRGGRSEQ